MFVSRKNILVSKPPNQFPNCWFHIPDENDPIDESSNNNIPIVDLETTKNLMDYTTKICNASKNANPEDQEWETKILKYGWGTKHLKLFDDFVRILDYERLSRLANVDNKRYEAVQRRIAIDKAADRVRKALAAVSWDTPMCQWIHGLMMEFLPPSYLAAYLDIMQTLKNQLPSLIDKMIFWKPGNVNQELLAPILKKPWQPALNNKYRKLPGNALLVVVPSAAPRLGPQSSRITRLYQLFTTMAPMLPVNLNINSIAAQRQSLQSIAEQTVSITRTKIQELKAENPDRRLILIGINSASALVLQVALVEQVSGVVCFGFSYNTVHGVRGQEDDHFLDVTTPIQFLIGQNAARCNEEEIEHFRGKIAAPTSMVVVGCSDDNLRMSKTKRRLEGVTQEMVDNMVVDEIADFATKCLQRPLPPRAKPVTVPGTIPRREIDSSNGQIRKRKMSSDGVKMVVTKTQKLMRPTSTTASSSEEVLEMAVQSILPEGRPASQQKFVTANRIVTMKKPASQITVRPQMNQGKYITISSQRSGAASQIQPRPILKQTPQTPQFVFSNRKVPQQQNFSPTKYTIVRTTNSTPIISDSSNVDLTGASIFDMPIVFADNEGNIDEDNSADGSVISVASDSPPSTNKQVVMKAPQPHHFTITKNKNILIQKPTTGKMFTINGMAIGKQFSANNIVLPKTLPQNIKVQKFVPNMKIVQPQAGPSSAANKKIEILHQTVIRPASTTNLTKIQSTSFVNLADAKPLTGLKASAVSSRLSLPIASTSKNQIVINTNTLKPFTGRIATTTIGNTQLGNLTVKRLNVVPSSTIQKVFKKN